MPNAESRFLERALIFTIIIHAIAMLSMALLLPGLPGGSNTELSARATYIAHHSWLWRLGWFPWQLTAVSDCLLGIALLRTPWIPKLPALLAALFTFAGFLPDQFAQFDWTWNGPSLAARAVDSRHLAIYEIYESRTFLLTAGWGAAGYTIGAIFWTWSFAAARVWSKPLLWISIAVWTLFAGATAIAFSPDSLRQSPIVTFGVSLGNALAFILLMLWLILTAELVMRRSRPFQPHGSAARWKHGSNHSIGALSNLIANSRLARELGRHIRALSMASDIQDVVYVNYLVEASRLESLVPEPLHLQRLGPNGQYAMFTFLIYRHGGFGPEIFGPLRRFWPSPIQSNWRIYVTNPSTNRGGVLFLDTSISSLPHALITRILADGIPMHVPAAASVERLAPSTIRIHQDPGVGTSQDLEATLTLSPQPDLPHPWNICFQSWKQMLEYCVPQDRAMCVHAGRVIRQEIDLNIPLDSCKPFSGPVHSRYVASLVGDAAPLSFLVERVGFRFTREFIDA